MSVSLSTPSTVTSRGTAMCLAARTFTRSNARSSFAARTAAGCFSFVAASGAKSSSHQSPLSFSSRLNAAKRARLQSVTGSECRKAYERAWPCPSRKCAASRPMASAELRMNAMFVERISSAAECISITMVGIPAPARGGTASSASGIETMKPSVPFPIAWQIASRVSSPRVLISCTSHGGDSPYRSFT